MTRRTSSKQGLRDLIRAICQVVKDTEMAEHDVEERPESAMNIQRPHAQEVAPVSSSHHHFPQRHDIIGQLLQPMIMEGKKGLSDIPQATLQQNLQPIVRALENLDAELLLDLEPAEHGPQVRKGGGVRPIYDDILPPIAGPDTTSNGHSCVRYLHISEVPEQYSIGIFVFSPYARIPLHDHPDMCVLSRVLYGDLQRRSLDLATEEQDTSSYNMMDAEKKHRNGSWLGGWFNRMESFRRKLPKGSKQAFKNCVDRLQAPDVTVLYPYEGNLHEFVAGPHGAAVLDVLLPPYDNLQNRDCTFYDMQEMTTSWPKPSGKEPCFIIPTGQPENFHCISGQYRDLGEAEDSD